MGNWTTGVNNLSCGGGGCSGVIKYTGSLVSYIIAGIAGGASGCGNTNFSNITQAFGSMNSTVYNGGASG